MTYVKICGLRDLPSALCALEAGADMVGFVFAPGRRQVGPKEVAAIVDGCRRRFPPAQRTWLAVGVFADQPLDFVREAVARCRLDSVQLSGQEAADYCRQVALPLYRTVHVPELRKSAALQELLREIKGETGATRLLLDSGGAGRWGGTGETFPWERIGEAARDCVVAGGLTPGNVAEAIAALRPWGVDTSSGVETSGRKDPELIKHFIMQVRKVDEYDGCCTRHHLS